MSGFIGAVEATLLGGPAEPEPSQPGSGRPPGSRNRRPDLDPDTVLLPLVPVHYESPDPLDAVMAQAFAVAFGLGDTTGMARFRLQRPHTSAGVGDGGRD